MNGIIYMNVDMLKDSKLYDKGLSMISDDRKQNIFKFKNPVPARLSLGAGILLRIALDKGGFADQINNIEYGIHGKPYLPNSDFHFNLSHSGEYAVCVYSNVPLGADIQKIKPGFPKHINRILTEEEQVYLDSMNSIKKTEAFYRLWARKESLIKWDSRGLRIPMNQISLIHQNELQDHILFEDKMVFLKEIKSFLPEYAFSICCEEKPFSDEVFEVTCDFLTNY